jgi:hypothetical protein
MLTNYPFTPMPAGQIMGMVKKMAEKLPIQQPISFEDLLRAKDRYIKIASILN